MKAENMNAQTPNAVHLVSRRGFLGNVFSAGALVLGSRLVSSDAFAAETVDTSAWHPSVYLGLEPDGRVIIAAHRSEMGTGIRTCLPAVVADELDADWKKVTIEQAIGDQKSGSQNTDGLLDRDLLPIGVELVGDDWKKVTIEQAIGDQKYGSQNTDGLLDR